MIRMLLVSSLIVADQFLKILATKKLLPSLGGVFHNTCNYYLSWGIPLKGVLFWVLWLIAFSGLFFLIKHFKYNFLLLLALSGAISNFIDRIIRGCVVDYIRIGSFPVFNLADALITIGLFLFVVILSKKNH